MKRSKSSQGKPNFVYPVDTEGARLASEIRAECNSLTAGERKKLFRQGLKMINAGNHKK